MDVNLFTRHEVKLEDGSYKVILHINPLQEEFGVEFGELLRAVKPKALKTSAIEYVQKNLPNVKMASVIVMSGSILLGNFDYRKTYAHEAQFNMSYLYFGTTSSYISQIDRTKGNLNLVSPSYFDINVDGSLSITKQFDPAFVNEMHKRNIKVVPFLSNHWDREVGRAGLKNRELLSQQIADFIMKNNLDGVQVDIENVSESDRDHYTDLVKLLRAKLPNHKEVSVAVAANPNAWSKGWHGSYDYVELAKYSNYIMIMAYDESFPGSLEGPVASHPWVERSIQYAIAQGVPSEKIVLGIPFYGRYWKNGDSNGGDGISNTRVDEMLSRYGGTVTFDEATKSPKATITIKNTDQSMIIGGKTLGPGTYTIWFENSQSIKAKIDLVHKYNLKGTGSWSLGQENPTVWTDYKTWMLTHDNAPQHPPTTENILDNNNYPTHTVQSGDTLTKIAVMNNLTIKQLMEYNNLLSDKILIGQVLYLVPPTTTLPPKNADLTTPEITGWVKQGTDWVYYELSGKLKTGWLLDGGKWYFLKNNGIMATGWILTGGKWYYLENSGAMKTGWVKDAGVWYFLENSGAMKTGWLLTGGKKNYLHHNGSMATGWKEINGKWYFFYTSGEMASNTTINGYKLNQDGVWVR
ncbi:glycosyl hydrolase family 18 protein [Bacillus sp. MRMR6]|uniref:glycosyl hydrolase family 18 protein n=1 Tax=Bacillus sp. MRMR6 TaxID=1928617 RepID=UPI0009520374|nr:glycosyl hydrolase family 18 protein [Bacillus sp. MRMR6]OLS39956.1 hypothetical protein BTR25_12235 [Bacillus sp. MRMR6]